MLELDQIPVLDEILTTREELQEIWTHSIPELSQRFPDLFSETTFPYKDFLWLRAVFDSRAFMVKIQGKEMPSLVPFADCANHSPKAQVTPQSFWSQIGLKSY